MAALAGVAELEQEDPVFAAARLEQVDEGLARNLDRDRLLASAVDHGRDHLLATQTAVGGLAGLFPAIHFDDEVLIHCLVPFSSRRTAN